MEGGAYSSINPRPKYRALRIDNSGFLKPDSIAPSIDLFIPADDKISYDDRLYESEPDPIRNDLCLEEYEGKIGVPKGVAIDIESKDTYISGIVHTPGQIYSDGNCNIDIVIPKQANLSVIINSLGPVFFNRKAIRLDERSELYLYGGSFDRLCTRYLVEHIGKDFLSGYRPYKKPRIIRSKGKISAEFDPSHKYHIQPDFIDVCIAYNVLNINKKDGVTSIFFNDIPYEPARPKLTVRQEIPKKKETSKKENTEDKPITVPRLRKLMEDAVRKEEYEKAALYKREIENLEIQKRQKDKER